MGELWITQKSLESFENEIAALTKEREELQNLYRNAHQLSQSCEKELNIITKERDRLKWHCLTLRDYNATVTARAERLDKAVRELENREASCCPEGTAFEDVIKQLRDRAELAETESQKWKDEANRLIVQLGKADAACVEIHEALGRACCQLQWVPCEDSNGAPCEAYFEAIKVWKSTTCGKGWLSPEKASELQAKVAEMKKILLDYRDTPNCGEYGVTAGWRDAVDHATSSECGKLILEKVNRLEEALDKIVRYPVHSSDKGCAWNMRETAINALSETEAK